MRSDFETEKSRKSIRYEMLSGVFEMPFLTVLSIYKNGEYEMIISFLFIMYVSNQDYNVSSFFFLDQ